MSKGVKLMGRPVYILALSVLVWATWGVRCRAAGQDDHQASGPMNLDRQHYQKKVDEEFHDLEQKINALKAKIAAEKGKVDQKQIDQDMRELDRKRLEAQQELGKLKQSSEKAWEDMKVGVHSAMQDLEAAYDRAATHFK